MSSFKCIILLLWITCSNAWMPVPHCPSTTSLGMISNFLGRDSSSSSSTLPKDVKDAVSQCRIATQEALKNRISRMDIEFPVGTKFGVEKGGTKKKKSDSTPTQEDLERSDRELARLFVDMFQPVGSDRIAVVLKNVDSADKTRKQWKGDPTAASRILSADRRKSGSKKKKKQSKGFAAKIAAEVDDNADESGPFQLPDNTEVALFVAPGPKEMILIERICNSVGMGTLVILLNARLSKISNFGSTAAAKLFLEDFEPVFSLAAADQVAAPNCLMYRAYPGDWILARKPKVGQPKTILTQTERPSADECSTAYENLDLSDVEKGMENVLENVAGWLS